MSATMACKDFLQTSGQWPISLRMPPAWPPMPRAQVLQVFLARIAFHSCHQPTRLAMRRVYLIAAQPPPRFIRFMVGKSCGESPVSGDEKFEEEPALNPSLIHRLWR